MEDFMKKIIKENLEQEMNISGRGNVFDNPELSKKLFELSAGRGVEAKAYNLRGESLIEYVVEGHFQLSMGYLEIKQDGITFLRFPAKAIRNYEFSYQGITSDYDLSIVMKDGSIINIVFKL